MGFRGSRVQIPASRPLTATTYPFGHFSDTFSRTFLRLTIPTCSCSAVLRETVAIDFQRPLHRVECSDQIVGLAGPVGADQTGRRQVVPQPGVAGLQPHRGLQPVHCARAAVSRARDEIRGSKGRCPASASRSACSASIRAGLRPPQPARATARHVQPASSVRTSSLPFPEDLTQQSLVAAKLSMAGNCSCSITGPPGARAVTHRCHQRRTSREDLPRPPPPPLRQT